MTPLQLRVRHRPPRSPSAGWPAPWAPPVPTSCRSPCWSGTAAGPSITSPCSAPGWRSSTGSARRSADRARPQARRDLADRRRPAPPRTSRCWAGGRRPGPRPGDPRRRGTRHLQRRLGRAGQPLRPAPAGHSASWQAPDPLDLSIVTATRLHATTLDGGPHLAVAPVGGPDLMLVVARQDAAPFHPSRPPGWGCSHG